MASLIWIRITSAKQESVLIMHYHCNLILMTHVIKLAIKLQTLLERKIISVKGYLIQQQVSSYLGWMDPSFSSWTGAHHSIILKRFNKIRTHYESETFSYLALFIAENIIHKWKITFSVEMLFLNRIKVLQDYVGTDQYTQKTKGMLTTIKSKLKFKFDPLPKIYSWIAF